MKNLACIRVTAAPETVIKKLSRADIPLFNLKKSGAYTTFCVNDKTVKKVFAIFSHPCYNVCVVKYGFVRSAYMRALSRLGVLLGAVIFVAAVCLSQLFVFRVEVSGSGAYLSPQVVAILKEQGVEAGRIYKGVDKRAVISQIMSLPSVTFCSAEKRGTAFVVDVECSEQGSAAPAREHLLSPVAGEVVRVVAVCGTPQVNAGDYVSRGDELISPYFITAEGTEEGCICAGYVDIRVQASVSSRADGESQSALSAAIAAAKLYSDQIEILSYSVDAVSDGVIYTVNFNYIYTASINMQ